MTVGDLFSLDSYEEYGYWVHEEDVHNSDFYISVGIENDLVKKFADEMIVEDIYSDCGVQVMIRVSKDIYDRLLDCA